MPVAANSRARLILQCPAAHVQVCAHAGCPFNSITNSLYRALFAISPLFCLFALRRFAEGQAGPHLQWLTPLPSPHATRDTAIFCEHHPNVPDVLMSTSDALKELLSSVHHALLHVHACMFACSCYMHVSSLIDVVLEQYMLHAACIMSITCVGFCATPSGTQTAKINMHVLFACTQIRF